MKIAAGIISVISKGAAARLDHAMDIYSTKEIGGIDFVGATLLS